MRGAAASACNYVETHCSGQRGGEETVDMYRVHSDTEELTDILQGLSARYVLWECILCLSERVQNKC